MSDPQEVWVLVELQDFTVGHGDTATFPILASQGGYVSPLTYPYPAFRSAADAAAYLREHPGPFTPVRLTMQPKTR